MQDQIKRPLTAKQSRFVAEYLIDLNGAQAAIRAGYSAKSAAEVAYENMMKPHIAGAIQAEMDKRAIATGITAERILKEIARLAFFDIRKLYDVEGRPLPVTALDDDTVAAISGIDIVTIRNSESGFGEVMKIRLADKLKALEMAGRHLKLFVDKVEVELSSSIAERLKAARGRIACRK